MKAAENVIISNTLHQARQVCTNSTRPRGDREDSPSQRGSSEVSCKPAASREICVRMLDSSQSRAGFSPTPGVDEPPYVSVNVIFRCLFASDPGLRCESESHRDMRVQGRAHVQAHCRGGSTPDHTAQISHCRPSSSHGCNPTQPLGEILQH